MTLFDECREALINDFNMLDGHEEREALSLLSDYPVALGGVLWNKLRYTDYDNLYDVLKIEMIKNHDVFVFADDAGIPLFRTNIKLIAENVYDVTALSPKLFIYNDEVIIQPLFPSERFRVGLRSEQL